MMTTDFISTPPPATQLDPEKRVNYSLGLVLGVDEFEQEQYYHLERGRQHNRALHGYGTVCGLQLSASGSQVYVSPGLAIDPRGRVIEVSRVQCADLNQWLAVPANLQAATGSVGSPLGQASVFVVLCYRECLTDNVPVPGAPCRSEEDSLAASRITESFDLRFTTVLPVAEEELAIRRFGELLRQIEISSSGPADRYLTVAQLEQLVRGLEPTGSPLGSPALSPLGQPLLLHPQDAEAVLRAGFRVWVTEVRPSLLATGCGVPVEGCVLLGQLDFDVTAGGHVAPQATPHITIDEDDRPYLLSTRLLQESLMSGVGVAEAVVSLGSPISAPPPPPPSPLTTIDGDATGPVAANRVVALQGRAVANTPPGGGQVLTFVGANNRWEPAALPPPPPPPLPQLVGDTQGPIGSNTVQRIRGVSVANTPARGDVLSGTDDGLGGVQWQAVAPSFVLHPQGDPTYGIVAAGHVQIGAAPAPAETYQKLVAILPGAAPAPGRVVLQFASFKPGTGQYIVKVLPSFDRSDLGNQVIPVVVFLGESTAPEGLVLNIWDARSGQPMPTGALSLMRLMVEISQFPFAG